MLSIIKKAVKSSLRLFGLGIVRVSNRPESTQAAQQSQGVRAFAKFISSKNEVFQLVEGYRKRLWNADWNTMMRERAVPSPAVVRHLGLIKKGRSQVDLLEAFLNIHGSSVSGKDILEVGCFDGAACYALAEKGARRVMGIDQARGFVPSPNPAPAEISEYAKWLEDFRSEVKAEFKLQNRGVQSNGVSFRDTDICDFHDESGFDLILSSSTLEHLLDFPLAFERMFAALKPGGLSLHQYHPFFCTSGAHFDTLDFPWGHVRLSTEDFKKYVHENRPDEEQIAEYRFFRTINRMTISDMKTTARSSGFEIEDVVLLSEDWRTVEPQAFRQGKEIYPSLCIQDLISFAVIVLLRKPTVSAINALRR